MAYKYYIKQKGEKYYFGLYPNNNHQSIGISGFYDSIDSANTALEKFKKLIKSAGDIYLLFDNICIEDNGVLKYKFVLKENSFDIKFSRERLYWSKYEVRKGINRIIKNIDAPLKFE